MGKRNSKMESLSGYEIIKLIVRNKLNGNEINQI
jgi:hypothetical protein